MISASAFAHDFEVGGIYYNKNSDGVSVSVTYRGRYSDSYSNEYSGAVVIPKSVTRAGTTYSVTSIGDDAFYWRTDLTEIHAKAATPPFCGSDAFRGINKETCTLYVPDASLSQYQAADQWKDFILMTTDGIQTTTDNATCAKEAARYNLGGQRLNGKQRGLNIIRYSDGTIKKVINQ